jgi:ribosomal protein S18 acetylase RimI-like enzyme
MTISIRPANTADAATLHAVAAATFALACPPTTTRESIDAFIATNLSTERFAGYLADPDRDLLLVVDGDGEPGTESAVGYSMIVYGEPADQDVASAITVRPSAEISKVYVMADYHGVGAAAQLMAASLAAARARGSAAAWLGVNEANGRANRFYAKSGFEIVGTKRFLLGDTYEDDYVRERVFPDAL